MVLGSSNFVGNIADPATVATPANKVRVLTNFNLGTGHYYNNDKLVTMDVLDARINALPRLLSGTAQPTADTGKAGDWYIVY